MLLVALFISLLALVGIGALIYNAQKINIGRSWFVSGFVGAAFLTFFTAFAVAQTVAGTAAPQHWWQALIDGLLPHVATVVVGVVGTLVALLLKRWGITVKIDQMDKLVAAAVGYAEQWAKQKLNSGAEPASGEEKKQQAVQFLLGLAAAHKVGGYTRDMLEKLIEAELGKVTLLENSV